MDSSRLRRNEVAVSSTAVDIAPPPAALRSSRASRTTRTCSSGGKPCEPNHSQMARSSWPGSRTTSARSTPRPARPTCW